MRRCTTVGGFGVAGILGLGMALAPLVLTGCSETENTTELNPEGPPEILQVFVVENTSQGAVTQAAFGSHPDRADIDDGDVTNAVALLGQRIRVVFDELLLGNNLEEIACADGSWSRIPVGATPDDVADCSGPVEVLGDCKDICIGANGPVGIRDEDDDGAGDDLRLIPGAVTIECDGVEAPLNEVSSFYQPSGNQLIGPQPTDVSRLGPALILVPDSGIRTAANCVVSLADTVVDKDNNQVCADGGSGCTAGDISAVSWTVEGLSVIGASPANNQTNVQPVLPTGLAVITLQFNAEIDDQTLAGLTLADETAAFPPCPDMNATGCIEAMLRTADLSALDIIVRGGFTPDNEHTLTVPTTVTDRFGGALPADEVITFTTATVAPMIDADTTDADTTDAGVGIDAP